TSPALIGGGYSENTDNDILRYGSSDAFLPGSSIAGVLRSLCPDEVALFGGQDNISPLWVFDSALNNVTVIELYGVALDRENKVALEQKKYDYEAISTGAGFTIRLLLTIRKGDTSKDFEGLLKKIVGAIKSGNVAFGAKTRRGFGWVSCISAVKREFDLSPGNAAALREWIGFDWENADGWSDAEGEDFSSLLETMTVKLALSGSIMIQYRHNIYEDLGANEKVPDYKHISIGGKPVILGTSWAGAISSGLYRLLKPRYPGKIGSYLYDVFGYNPESGENGTDDDMRVSQITFGASTLTATNLTTDGYRSITRVKIDRFSGGAADGALFCEKPWYGGETALEMRYPANRDDDIKELLFLAFECIDKGIFQVGGEGSIGRGFFKIMAINGNPPEAVLGNPKQALAEAIQRAGATE
ncbi:MAG: RAMP superfamily CRISPR-associated protein, partial [Syntrophomonadaceae bacterium]|nr:RAMP superfamily CRISPR-associated protein [Syntrophomonadaceae bacterium]